MDRRQIWTLTAAITGSSMVFLDSTVVTVALPTIGRSLPTATLGVLEAQSYVYNGYLLSLGSLLVVAGALADVHGRRRMYILGLFAFAGASLICGLAPTMELLIVARVLQGAAGAVLVPGSLALITTAFTGDTRGRAFGVWAGASGIATILGPLAGGLLVDLVSWRAVFLLNLPLAAFGLWATVRYVAESRDPGAEGRVDLTGALVAALALGGLTLGAIRGQERAWQDPAAFVALGVGVIATAAFVPLMARSRQPLVPLWLFRSRNFAVINAATVTIYGGLYVTSYFLVVFLQGTLGYNAAAAGVATIPTVVFLALFAARIGTLAARHGPRWYLTAGPALMTAGVALLALVPAGSDAWLLRVEDPATWVPPTDYVTGILPGLVLFGLGIMVVVAPLTTTLMESVPEEHSGIASAVNNALSRVGPQLATALLFVAVTATFYDGLAQRLGGIDPGAAETRARFEPLHPPAGDADPATVQAAREASTEAFRRAMLAAGGLTAAGAITNAVGIRNPRRPIQARRPPECLPGATPPS